MYHKGQGIAYIVRGDSQGQYRQCRGPRDTFFHEHCSQLGPPRYIVFILQMENPDNLCSENLKRVKIEVLIC